MTPHRPAVSARVLRGAIPLSTVLALLFLAAGPAVAASGPSATLVLGSDGSLTAGISAVLSNGSALRYAIDGNFGPIISALPVNHSEQVALLTEIETAESTPIASSLFGNRDGSVEPGEVTLFESLLLQQSKLLPSGSLTGTNVVSLTLNGQAATSARVADLAFIGAEGSDASPAPITVASTIDYAFAYGSGAQTIALGPGTSTQGLTGLNGSIPVVAPAVSVSLTLPSQTTISSATGFDQSSVHNDPWGLGPSSVEGEYTPAPNSTVTVQFHPSFPTAYLAIGLAVAALAAAAALLLLVRRRRGRARVADPPPWSPPATDEKVGPSGSA